MGDFTLYRVSFSSMSCILTTVVHLGNEPECS